MPSYFSVYIYILILLLDAVSVLIHTLCFLPFLAFVSLSIEPDEEDEVEAAVEHQDEVEADREAAGRVDEGHDAVNKHHDELDELHGGEVPLPPEMPLDPGAAGGQEVVRVHRTVHQGVPHSSKCCVSAPLCPDIMIVMVTHRSCCYLQTWVRTKT